jgi:hypothetical protein
MANEVLQESLNEDLIIMEKRKKARSRRSKKTGGKAQVMTWEYLQEIAAEETEERFEIEAKALRRLTPGLIGLLGR